MKFSDITQEQWESLAPYLDTCLLPLTGLDGAELPWEATAALENLRDFLDLIEVPFRGRVVTYPAAHYTLADPHADEALDKLCARLKQAGFRYVIAASHHPALADLHVPHADLVLTSSGDLARDKEEIAQAITRMWSKETEKEENV